MEELERDIPEIIIKQREIQEDLFNNALEIGMSVEKYYNRALDEERDKEDKMDDVFKGSLQFVAFHQLMETSLSLNIWVHMNGYKEALRRMQNEEVVGEVYEKLGELLKKVEIEINQVEGIEKEVSDLWDKINDLREKVEKALEIDVLKDFIKFYFPNVYRRIQEGAKKFDFLVKKAEIKKELKRVYKIHERADEETMGKWGHVPMFG
jgi:hypothetical protein